MHYERNQYSEGFSICSLIIAGGFLWWGFSTLMTQNYHWWWWSGFIWILIGIGIISSQIYAIANRSKLRNFVKLEFEQNPNVSIEQISENTGITLKDVRSIVLDLKARGELKGKFSTKTGEAKYIEVISDGQPEIQTQGIEKGKYCSNCGIHISKDAAVYCAYCGAKL
jgi:hypothetical protein